MCTRVAIRSCTIVGVIHRGPVTRNVSWKKDMSHALGENDWYDWEDDTHRGARNQFRWSLQALACKREDQIALFPDFVDKPYELVCDYDNWSQVARSSFAGLFSDDQLRALQAIDVRIETMSRGGTDFDEALWNEDALGTRSEWEELRSLSKSALALFEWPIDKPPSGRSMYVRGPNSA